MPTLPNPRPQTSHTRRARRVSCPPPRRRDRPPSDLHYAAAPHIPSTAPVIGLSNTTDCAAIFMTKYRISCTWHVAVLPPQVPHLYTLEPVRDHASKSETRGKRLRKRNVHVVHEHFRSGFQCCIATVQQIVNRFLDSFRKKAAWTSSSEGMVFTRAKLMLSP